jgi:hypothetical protein
MRKHFTSSFPNGAKQAGKIFVWIWKGLDSGSPLRGVRNDGKL